MCRSSLNLSGWLVGVICELTDTTIDRLPFALAATNCV
jgi:hypothetical protein